MGFEIFQWQWSLLKHSFPSIPSEMLPSRIFWPNSILIHLLFLLPKCAIGLICYSCTTTLSPVNIEENAKMALRLFLNSVYELPPVHRFCNLEDDIEFKTVPTVQCSTANDQCVKVRAESEGLEFVIRGCKSKIYKPDVTIPENVECRSTSPSLCFCKDNHCNWAQTTSIGRGTFLIATTMLILTNIIACCF